jgi:hypothetical protein
MKEAAHEASAPGIHGRGLPGPPDRIAPGTRLRIGEEAIIDDPLVFLAQPDVGFRET